MFSTTWGWLNAHPAAVSLSTHVALERITLALWPVAWMLAATESSAGPGDVVLVMGVALVANVLCYLIFGGLAWLGLKKHRGFFVPLVLMASLWFWYVWHT